MKEKINKFIHSKNFIIILILLLISLIGIVGTYAWFTWSSTENTSLTLTIGKLADVTFDNGNDINITNLAPVFNYTDGEKTTFSINNKDTTGALIKYSVKLNITTISPELISDGLKYKLLSNGTEISSGDFSSVSVGTTINIIRSVLLFGTTDFEFYLYIDGNIENDSNMMNKTLIGNIEVTAEEITLSKNLAERITTTYSISSKTTVENNNITYNTAPSVNLMNDRLGGTTIDLDGGNIRYYGATPNNYIYFNCEEYPNTNCELWQIIGVFNGKVKIIRNETLGAYSWDTSASNVNSGKGINEWSQADLMKLLNPGYENNIDLDSDGNTITVNNSLYYNSGSGTCYNEVSNATTTCDFTSTGIKNDITRNMINNATFYLSFKPYKSNYSDQLYVYERDGTLNTNPSDGITRTTEWIGKIALPYPSDYGFAADLNVCTMVFSSAEITRACRQSNYLNKYTLRLLEPTQYSSTTTTIYDGYFSLYRNDASENRYGIYPTLYLNSDILFAGGYGTSSNPYKISKS